MNATGEYEVGNETWKDKKIYNYWLSYIFVYLQDLVFKYTANSKKAVLQKILSFKIKRARYDEYSLLEALDWAFTWRFK